MKVNDRKALHAKSAEELQKLIKEGYNTLSNARIENEQNRLKNTRSIFNTRKEIAVMQSILRAKQNVKEEQK